MKLNNSKQIAEKIFKLERELNLFDKKVNGIYFWEKIRRSVVRDILMDSDVIGEAHTKKDFSFANVLRFGVKYFTKSFFTKNPFFSSQKNILFLGHIRKKPTGDGRFQDLFCSPIISKLKKKDYIYLEGPYLLDHIAPLDIDNVKYMDFLEILIIIMKKIGLFSVKLNLEEKELIGEIERELEKEIGVRIKLEKEIKRKLRIYKTESYLYTLLLKKIKPKVVIFVVGSGREAIIDVCRKFNIKTVELQHGVINRYHLDYSAPTKNNTRKAYPDYMFLFGDYWKESVGYSTPKSGLIPVGYAYLEQEIEKYKNLKKEKQILLISQGPIGKYLSKFAVKLSKKELPYNITYKLHPGEYDRWKTEYPWLLRAQKKGKIRVIDSDIPPFYKLMAESEIQIGVSSTAIYEGLCFNLKTYVLNVSGVEYMDYLVEKKIAKKINNVQDFVNDLNRSSTSKHINREYFFKSNAVNNAIRKINSIIS